MLFTQVKNDVYALTNLPARHQIWTGWPDSAKNDDSVRPIYI